MQAAAKVPHVTSLPGSGAVAHIDGPAVTATAPVCLPTGAQSVSGPVTKVPPKSAQ